MAGRLTRFLNLEKARKPNDTPAGVPVTAARFSGEAPPAASPDAMFRAEREAQLASGVEVEQTSDAEQPFLRCPVCEADNSKFAVKCINCQARLDTDEVHAWNARLWQQRRAARELEVSKAAAPPLVEQNRLLGESLARAVAEREKLKMGQQDWSYSSEPIGMRLLELIGNPNVRFAVAMALVATFFAAGTMAYVARHHPVLQTVGIVVAVGLLVLFTPNRSRSNRRWWDDWD
ncbi:MAG: hypothetical protein ACXWLM_05060 [Myxococcales bacterium]